MDKLVRTDSSLARRISREERPVHPCTRDFVFSLATCGSLFVLGSWSLTAVGCAAGAKTNEQRTAQRRNMNPVSAEKIAAKTAAKNAAMGIKASAPQTAANGAVVTNPVVADGALSSLDSEQSVLNKMAARWAKSGAVDPTTTSATSVTQTNAPSVQAMLSSTAPNTKTYKNDGTPVMLGWNQGADTQQGDATNWGPAPHSRTGSNWNGSQNGTWTGNALAGNTTFNGKSGWTGNTGNSGNFANGFASGNNAQANSTLAVANNTNESALNPNDPMQLSKLLANAFAQAGSGSMDPLRVWFIYSSLAVSNPDITLPEGWGADLLPAERDRVQAAFAGFSALGRAFRTGANEVDSATRQALVAALAGEPALTIPKVDLATKVAGYGDYSPVSRRSFLAGGNNRVIVYSELDGFKSHLENGKWTTRLATRVSIVPTNAPNATTIAWSRTPEWTEVVDTSDAPRCEFFLGEIIPIANSLAAGNYHVKVEVKDLATGATTSSYLPIEVLDERAFAAVND
jgi:hypothetical protein